MSNTTNELLINEHENEGATDKALHEFTILM